MNNYTIEPGGLNNESDVEQKVVFPLLNSDNPVGLGYDSLEIKTKTHLKVHLIDKGKKSFLIILTI